MEKKDKKDQQQSWGSRANESGKSTMSSIGGILRSNQPSCKRSFVKTNFQVIHSYEVGIKGSGVKAKPWALEVDNTYCIHSNMLQNCFHSFFPIFLCYWIPKILIVYVKTLAIFLLEGAYCFDCQYNKWSSLVPISLLWMLALELLHIYNGGNLKFYGLIQHENDNENFQVSTTNVDCGEINIVVFCS